MNDEKLKKAELAIVNLTIYNSFESINNRVNEMGKEDEWLGGIRDAILAIRELDAD